MTTELSVAIGLAIGFFLTSLGLYWYTKILKTKSDYYEEQGRLSHRRLETIFATCTSMRSCMVNDLRMGPWLPRLFQDVISQMTRSVVHPPLEEEILNLECLIRYLTEADGSVNLIFYITNTGQLRLWHPKMESVVCPRGIVTSLPFNAVNESKWCVLAFQIVGHELIIRNAQGIRIQPKNMRFGLPKGANILHCFVEERPDGTD